MRNHELSLHFPKVDTTLVMKFKEFTSEVIDSDAKVGLINNNVLEDYTIKRQMVISFKWLHTSFTYYIKSSSKKSSAQIE